MLTYATAADFNEQATSDLTVEQISRLLTTASRLVRLATKTAIYDVDSAGKPSDPDVLEAFRDATVIHAQALATAGITSPSAGATAGAGGVVASASILGASITYAAGSNSSGATADREALLAQLCPDALWCLESAGLVRAVQTW